MKNRVRQEKKTGKPKKQIEKTVWVWIPQKKKKKI